MSTYPSIAAYTVDVIAARDAYRADREVKEGRCENGDGRKRDKASRSRRCWACRHKKGA